MDEFVINRADEYGRSIYLRDRPATTRSVVFTGAPGAGKSFVLRQVADQARADGHLVIKIDASSREPLQSRMTRAIGDQLDQLKHETPPGAAGLLRRLHKTLDTMLSNRFDIQNAISGSLSWWPPLRIAFTRGHDRQYERPTSSVNDLADRLGDLAADRGKQVMLLIDNLDRAQESDLATINELAAHLDTGERPVGLTLAASQPALDKLLVAAMPEGLASDAARCYDVRTCSPVPAAELRPALTARIARSGTAVLPDAADRLVTEANGDPGRLLRLADRATELATGPHGVTPDVATAAISRMRHDDAWIYRAGWNNLTGRAKAILADAATDPDGLKIAGLNDGTDLDEWAERDAARAELAGAGLVRETDGRLVVADPGMSQWISDHGTGHSTAEPGATKQNTTDHRPVEHDSTKSGPSQESASEKSRPKKAPDKTTSAKKATAKKSSAKKSAAQKTAAKTSTAKTSTAKKTAAKSSGAKKSAAKASTVTKSHNKTSASKKTASTTAAKASSPKKKPAAKSPRPPIDLHAVQPPAARALNARRAMMRPAGEPTGRAS